MAVDMINTHLLHSVPSSFLRTREEEGMGLLPPQYPIPCACLSAPFLLIFTYVLASHIAINGFGGFASHRGADKSPDQASPDSVHFVLRHQGCYTSSFSHSRNSCPFYPPGNVPAAANSYRSRAVVSLLRGGPLNGRIARDSVVAWIMRQNAGRDHDL